MPAPSALRVFLLAAFQMGKHPVTSGNAYENTSEYTYTIDGPYACMRPVWNRPDRHVLITTVITTVIQFDFSTGVACGSSQRQA